MASVIPDTQDSEKQSMTLPYPPSWVDRFTAWVERRPWSSNSSYLTIGVGLLIIQALVVWAEGALPFGNINIAQAYLAGAIAFMLAMIQFLDSRAGAALETMRPVLKGDGREFSRLFFELTTLPSRTTLLASLAALIFVFLTEAIGEPYKLDTLETFPVSVNFLRFIYLACWWMFGVFLYHTAHQLRVINVIYTKYTRVDLLHVKPLYAFSKIAALTAGSVAVLGYGWLFANPWMDRSDPLIFFQWLFSR